MEKQKMGWIMAYDINRLVFLLGGMDLEMEAIKKMLTVNQAVFIAKNLHWGAKRSAYSNEIASLLPGQIPVFVELFPDIHYEGECIVVDHHGYGKTDRLLKDDTIDPSVGKDKPTSIEQIAHLLSITLTREQQLVSAYDKDFMKGLQFMKPSEDEIQQIIDADFKIHEVSAADVKAAEDAIENTCQEVLNKYCWVISENPKTIPVFMKLHEKYKDIKNFAVFVTGENENTLHFSGEGSTVLQLIKKFREDKELPDTYWYGGALPERGYFGAAIGKPMAMYEFQALLAPEEQHIFSQHIFLFPLRIENKNKDEAQLSYDSIRKLLEEQKEYPLWKQYPINRKNFDKLNAEDQWLFNELHYFHEFSRKALFTVEDENSNDIISDYYELQLEKPLKEAQTGEHAKEKDDYPLNTFCITVIQEGKRRKFFLNINTIGLHYFETGIGILAFTLYNTRYKDFNDVLIINDYGRRVYPQFVGNRGVINTKESFLPDSITLNLRKTAEPYR
ncbi:MAG: hypothetical protein HY965_00960, partial [Ignavibacteriales bacterium]|nr:hypothetical protein [Ignavibacteriales bacterium]